MIWITGVLYQSVNMSGPPLANLALAQVIAAYAMAVFVAIHVYMATTGATVTAYLRVMITGYDRVDGER